MDVSCVGSGTPSYNKILARFGPSILLPPSSPSSSSSSSSPSSASSQSSLQPIDRSALGSLIFNSDSNRAFLNSITHPAVRRQMARELVGHWLRGEWCVVVDVPLLIETGLWKWVGRVVVVYVCVLPCSKVAERHEDVCFGRKEGGEKKPDADLDLGLVTSD
jgi:hypothetical protein